MKKLMSAVVAAIAVAASAATWERAGSLQVADTTGLAVAVAKLGEISGNQMLGTMAAAQLSQLPTSEFFGPARQGGSIALPLYFDVDAFEKAGAGDEDAFDGLDDGAVEYAVVYPMAIPKEEFMKLHEGAAETNGMVRVQGFPFGNAGDGDFTYVAFADGGKWAVASDKPEQVALALKDLEELVKPMEGDVLRMSATPKCFETVRKVLDVVARKCAEGDEKLDVEPAFDLAKGLDSMRLALRVGDAGVDFVGGFSAVPGSALSKMGATSFTAKSLSEAGPEALSFSKSSFYKTNIRENWKLVAKVLARHKIDTSSFLRWRFGKTSRLTVNMPAFVSWAKAAETNGLAEVDCDELSNDLAAALSGKCKYVPAEAPEGFAVAFAGYKPKFSARDRFIATLPEVKGRKLASASVFSLSGLVQAILPSLLASLDDETRAMVAPVAAMLPKEAKCGIASASWREDDGSVAGLMRISADEIRGIGASAGAIMAATMMNVGADAPGVGSSDED